MNIYLALYDERAVFLSRGLEIMGHAERIKWVVVAKDAQSACDHLSLSSLLFRAKPKKIDLSTVTVTLIGTAEAGVSEGVLAETKF